jgi:NAD(P)H-hydrate repair Nnr-like enzyme with NAD(P)H-hydrate dehydratase domain
MSESEEKTLSLAPHMAEAHRLLRLEQEKTKKNRAKRLRKKFKK